VMVLIRPPRRPDPYPFHCLPTNSTIAKMSKRISYLRSLHTVGKRINAIHFYSVYVCFLL